MALPVFNPPTPQPEIPSPRPHSFVDPQMTLKQARELLLNGVGAGTVCPCCRQFAKVYRRALNAPMARWLIWIVKAFLVECRWYDFRESPMIQARKGGGDFAKLLHWGLIQTAEPSQVQNTKRTSGLYRPTSKGINYALGRMSVPSHVFLYNNTVAGWSDKKVTIQEALGEQFDYRALMAAA